MGKISPPTGIRSPDRPARAKRACRFVSVRRVGGIVNMDNREASGQVHDPALRILF